MASQAVGFAELLVAAVLGTAGIGSSTGSIRDVLAGKVKGPVGFATSAPGGAAAASSSGEGPAATLGKGGHANPLPNWHRSRIDAGVDFYGGKRIYAPEAGTIEKLGPYGGPSGGFGPGGILLHTISGKTIYFYEGLVATVHDGEKVLAGQAIANAVPGGSIEVGFADSSGNPLAQADRESTGNNVTKFGRKAAEWLNLLGAPR